MDINAYRINYSREWLSRSADGYTIPAFPCVGAVHAIHALCDEIERMRAIEKAALLELDDAFRKELEEE